MAEEEKVSQKMKDVDFGVDLDSIPDGQEIDDLDPKANAFEFPAPPKAGVYALKVMMGEDGIKMGELTKGDPSTSFFSARPNCTITDDGDYKGRTLSGDLSTIIWRNAKTSTMATFLNKAGVKNVEGKITAKQQAHLFYKLMKREPTISAEVEWRAWSSEEPNKKGGKGKYILFSMDQFPKDEEGNPIPQARDSKGNICFARLYVKAWLGKGETPTTKKPTKTRVIVDDDVDLGEDDNTEDLPF